MRKFDEFFQEARRKVMEAVEYDPTQEEIINNSDNIPSTKMGKGRNYNKKPVDEDNGEEKTSKVKKVTLTRTEEESNAAEASPNDNNNNNNNEVPVANAGSEDSKPVSEREPEGDTATTDDDRYKAASGN